jgi:hypothetical protein
MRYVKIIVGLLFVVGSFLSFGVGCWHTGMSDYDWMNNLLRPGAISRFGRCVANVDRLFSSSQSVVPLALSVALLFIGIVFLLAARKKKSPAQNA